MRLTRKRDRPPLEQWACVLLIALLTAGLWFGWDTEYRTDPATGETTGPYEIWQGVAAFLCSLVVVGLAYRLLQFAVALLVLPISFTFAWISTASAVDSNGPWAVGAILVAVGSILGAAIMLGIAAGVETSANKRRTRSLRSSDV